MNKQFPKKVMRILWVSLACFQLTFSSVACVRAQGMSSLGDTTSNLQEKTKEEWMREWFESKPPVGALHLYRFADEIYVVTKPISWIPSEEQRERYKRVDVPVGFVTDLASVPRIFWQFLPRDGKYTYPAIIHDYMYWEQDQQRETSDDILRIGMEEFDLNSVVINAVYWGVRAGGASAWNSNAALKSKGEKRVLNSLPTDPMTSWKEWKKNGDVFK